MNRKCLFWVFFAFYKLNFVCLEFEEKVPGGFASSFGEVCQNNVGNITDLQQRSDNEVGTLKFIHTHMCAFKLASRTASLRGRLLWRWGWRDGGWWLSLWDWWSREWRSSPLLLLYLLRDGLVSLGIQIQDLMADI